MEFRDYYQTLGVSRDASADEIRKAFRKLARKYHPDVSHEADADARMKEINEAYAILGDRDKRAAYDRLGKDFAQRGDFSSAPGWDNHFDWSGAAFGQGENDGFSDFFAELFGRMGGSGGDRTGHRRESNQRAEIVLDLQDSLQGATRKLTLQLPERAAEGQTRIVTRTLSVGIPRGICEGQTIRLAGQGGTDEHGTRGDLLLTVRFRPDPRIRAEGRDLHLRLPVSPWEAALGAEIALPLPDGKVALKIPQGSASGRRLRMRGRGIPANPPGDLLVELQVVLPPASDPTARSLYERMAREIDFDPRGSPQHA